jgi:hypothetical protein
MMEHQLKSYNVWVVEANFKTEQGGLVIEGIAICDGEHALEEAAEIERNYRERGFKVYSWSMTARINEPPPGRI